MSATTCTRRTRSFGETTIGSPPPSSKDEFIRKPMRRRSQSFQQEDAVIFSTDGESTDDDQRLSYNLPGHLVATNDHGKAPTPKQPRRSSMPLSTMGLLNVSTPKERRQRRESIRASQQRRESIRSGSIPSHEDLGYGGGEDMDATAKRGNRRRESTSNSCNSIQNNSSGRWDSMSNSSNSNSNMPSCSSRRMSMPSTALPEHVVPAPTSTASRCMGSVSERYTGSSAPRMPTRVFSDGSGSDTDAGFVSPPPSSDSSSGNRRRRMSMPLYSPTAGSSSDEDGNNRTMDNRYPQLNIHNSFMKSPELALGRPRLRSDPSPSMYGMNLGYGYDHQESSKEDKELVGMPTTSLGLSSEEAPLRLLGSSGHHTDSDSAPSADELGYGERIPRVQRRPRRRMRRCSTGGALDARLIVTNKVQEQASTTTTTSMSRMHRRRSSTGGACANVPSSTGLCDLPGVQIPPLWSKDDSCCEDNNVYQDDTDTDGYGDDDSIVGTPTLSLPSHEDLGYGDYAPATPTTEDLGYGDLGYGNTTATDGEESDIGATLARANAHSRARRRRSSLAASAPDHHHRRGSTTQGYTGPIARRRSSVGCASITTTTTVASSSRSICYNHHDKDTSHAAVTPKESRNDDTYNCNSNHSNNISDSSDDDDSSVDSYELDSDDEMLLQEHSHISVSVTDLGYEPVVVPHLLQQPPPPKDEECCSSNHHSDNPAVESTSPQPHYNHNSNNCKDADKDDHDGTAKKGQPSILSKKGMFLSRLRRKVTGNKKDQERRAKWFSVTSSSA